MIASKPSFILGELKATALPVVFLDTDLEFYSFPHLFVKGGWPNGGRDVAIFNYWGNETDPEHAASPNTGSGVVFFNQTRRAKSVLTAWAEAMAWEENTKAPDDQVFDTILKEGGWLGRTSLGWLPSSYLRTMPAYSRGISPVIDHDRGSAPGLLKHSARKPHLPPIAYWEPCDPDHGRKDHTHEAAPVPASRGEERPQEPPEPPPEPEEAPPPEPEKPAAPLATCTATSPELGADDSQVRGEWSEWCMAQCNPPDGSAEACATPEMTGNAMCVCKSKAELERDAKAQAKADTEEARTRAKEQVKADAMAKVKAKADAEAQAKAEAAAKVQADADAKAQAKAAEEEGKVWAKASGIEADLLCPGHPHILRSSPSCKDERVASLAIEAARMAAGTAGRETLKLDEGAD